MIVTILAVAVEVMPGLAILSARSLARLLYRALCPHPEEAQERGPEPGRGCCSTTGLRRRAEFFR